MASYELGPKPPRMLADLAVSVAPPTSGLPYEFQAATPNIRLLSVTANVVWTVQPDPLEIRIVVDGQTWNHIQANPVSARNYTAQIVSWNAEAAQGMADSTVIDPSIYKPFLLEGRNVQVLAETTGGTVSQLNVRIKRAQY